MEMTNREKYLSIIIWAEARYNPSRRGRDTNTFKYRAIVNAAARRYIEAA